jgi:hypothetical protein
MKKKKKERKKKNEPLIVVQFEKQGSYQGMPFRHATPYHRFTPGFSRCRAKPQRLNP